MRALNRISDITNIIVEHLVAILMGVMTVVVFMQVIFRLIAGSLPWSEELSRYVMIYMVYVGASAGVKHGTHIAIEFVVGLLPEKKKYIAEIIADILMLISFAIIIYFGIRVVKVTMMQKSPVLRLKMGYIYFALVLGGILMFFQGMVNLIGRVYALTTGKPMEKSEPEAGAGAAEMNAAEEKKGGEG